MGSTTRTVTWLTRPLRRTQASQDTPTFVITSAQPGLSHNQSTRTRRYVASMLVRTACVLAAIITPGWPRWVLIAAAVVLPYLAVVAANTPPPRTTANEAFTTSVSSPYDRALEARQQTDPQGTATSR